jgi:dynein heavy chain, axonemal
MLKSINQEEVYLDWDPSNYPLLQKIKISVERYSSLWHTALDFHENYERWYYGPFLGLDTEAIQAQVRLDSLINQIVFNEKT